MIHKIIKYMYVLFILSVVISDMTSVSSLLLECLVDSRGTACRNSITPISESVGIRYINVKHHKQKHRDDGGHACGAPAVSYPTTPESPHS